MKERELRDAAKCVVCRGKIGAALTFHRVTLERFMFRPDALQRRHGLDLMMGRSALAGVFSPDEDLATAFRPPVTVSICQDCSVRSIRIAEIDERAQQRHSPLTELPDPV